MSCRRVSAKPTPVISTKQVIALLEAEASEENRAGMARYGINTERAYGISVKRLREIATSIGTGHEIAEELWGTGMLEARILASLVDEPAKVTPEGMEEKVRGFDSWALWDGYCNNLFRKTPFAHAKVQEWTLREETFVRRAGFSLMANLAVHDKKAADSLFEGYLALIEDAAADERNFVKKAVNWALRQIGKRSPELNRAAIACAERLAARDSKSARWNAKDALRELTSEKVQARLVGRA